MGAGGAVHACFVEVWFGVSQRGDPPSSHSNSLTPPGLGGTLLLPNRPQIRPGILGLGINLWVFVFVFVVKWVYIYTTSVANDAWR